MTKVQTCRILIGSDQTLQEGLKNPRRQKYMQNQDRANRAKLEPNMEDSAKIRLVCEFKKFK